MLSARTSDRTAFLHALDACLAKDSATVGVVRVDLDRFSRIGRTFGPAVARTVGSVLQARMHSIAGTPEHLLAYGVDSFVIIVSVDDDRAETLEATGMEIVDLISSPIDIAGERIAVGCNVGITAAAHFPEPDALRILAAAEFAIQRADTLGSRRVIVYEVAQRDDPTRLPQLFADMLPAITAGHFISYFQPVVSLESGTVVGAEGLVRWDHPQHGVIPPSEFLPEAEASGLIRQIDANVRQAACTACAQRPSDKNVSVNISAADLDAPALVDSVDTALRTTGLSADRLVLEVTETALSQDWTRARRRLEALRELGVRIAVDDFGAGHMFLDRLALGLFDILKVDRSLVVGEASGRQSALLASVVALADALGLEVIAEGVETPEHLDRVVSAGCAYGQGFYFGRPMSGTEFLTSLTAPAEVSRGPIPA